jgi:hypothetical protein
MPEEAKRGRGARNKVTRKTDNAGRNMDHLLVQFFLMISERRHSRQVDKSGQVEVLVRAMY